MNIRLFRPSVGDEELREIKKAIDRAWLGMGPCLDEFEAKWSAYIGCKMSLGLNSATAALHLALTAFRFPEGKKVLVPSLTFASSATAILYNNLVPVFVDVDEKTCQMSLEDLENKYSDDCVAVVAVHYAGHPAEIAAIRSFCRQKGLKLIEDCAHAAGGAVDGRNLGTWGDFGCFSFEEKKCMTTGDGGMLCSDDVDLLRSLKPYRWVGIDKDTWQAAKRYTDAEATAKHWFYEISVLGYKYNMNDVAAAIGLAQLEKLDAMNARRGEIIRLYLEGLRNIEGIEPLLPFAPEEYVYQMFGIRSHVRDELMIYLKSKGVATGCHYTPLSLQPLFREFGGRCPVTEAITDTFITLPLHAELRDEEVHYILDQLGEFARK